MLSVGVQEDAAVVQEDQAPDLSTPLQPGGQRSRVLAAQVTQVAEASHHHLEQACTRAQSRAQGLWSRREHTHTQTDIHIHTNTHTQTDTHTHTNTHTHI